MSVTFRVQKLISSLESSKPSVKYDAVKALRTISERAPHAVYPHFDLFVNYLRHENSILRWNAMLILANLASVDDEGQLDEILDDYLAAINGCRMIDAANAIRGAAVIACAKPYLADTIASRIMQVEHANYGTPECRNVGIGHAIEALGRIRPELADTRDIQRFVARQLENQRPATRKKAERFIGTKSSGKARAAVGCTLA